MILLSQGKSLRNGGGNFGKLVSKEVHRYGLYLAMPVTLIPLQKMLKL
jgi:hypothetical protein